MKKLKHLDEHATVAEVESMMGRLLHVSSILGINPARWYWLLKAIRRKLNMVNRGLLNRDDECGLSTSAQKDFDDWITLAMTNTPRLIQQQQPVGRRYVLFTDSSGDGWGAVLVDAHTGIIRVAGGTWATSSADNIGPGEVRALTLGVAAFAPIIELQGTKLLCLVDNTSTIAAGKRGQSRSAAMNEEVLRLQKVLDDKNVTIHMEYVPSRFNLSDGPSRGQSITQTFLLDARG
jgi:hypothetical protein